MNKTTSFSSYTIGEDSIEEIPVFCKGMGKRVMLIWGRQAYASVEDRLLPALNQFSIVASEAYGHDCTEKEIARLAAIAQLAKPDFILGIGGGKALDTTKGCADRIGVPVFTLPTIAATCAAVSALSVVYREDGSFQEFYFYNRPAIHCFIDLKVIANAPVCYLRAGLGDSLGKHFECHLSARGDHLDHSSWMGREISNLCYEPFLEHGRQALEDCEAHHVSESLTQVVLNNIISTGMVSVLVEDCYNCAIAHSVFYGLALYPHFEEEHLHGDVVAYGVLVQLLVDKDTETFRTLRQFLQSIGIPVTLKEMNVAPTASQWEQILGEIVTGPDMEHLPYEVTRDMIYTAIQENEAFH